MSPSSQPGLGPLTKITASPVLSRRKTAFFKIQPSVFLLFSRVGRAQRNSEYLRRRLTTRLTARGGEKKRFIDVVKEEVEFVRVGEKEESSEMEADDWPVPLGRRAAQRGRRMQSF